MRRAQLLTILLGILLPAFAHAASSDKQVAALLANASAPPGVVFEIVSGDENALRWAIPVVTRYAEQLRARFPDLEIAVVSHGNEQFALLDDHAPAYGKVHDEVRTLSQRKNVSVHVCGTLAGFRNITPEEFPAYVDVAAAGPARINDYRALGYTHILVTRPKLTP